ncbi:MAG: M1 family aminopeptidase [Candidatus Omnitrophota bacterium]
MKNHKIQLIIFLVIFMLLPFLSRPALLFAFEDIQYTIDAYFDQDQKTVEAKQVLTFKNNTGVCLDEIYLRVYPNHHYSRKEIDDLYRYASYFKVDPYPDGFDPGVFTIASLSRYGGESLAYVFEGEDQTVMKVILDRPLLEGESFSLEIHFKIRVPHRVGRYGWHNDTFALNRWYPLLSVYDKNGWHNDADYLLHMPYMSESAIYEITLDVPQEYVVASGAVAMEEPRDQGNRNILHYRNQYPLREFSLAMSKDYHVLSQEWNGVMVHSYYLKKDEAAGRKALGFAIDMMRYYTKQFGEYPYRQFSIAPVYLGCGGTQNAGLIFVDRRAYRMPGFLDRYFDFLIAHETGHQWWYNVVGNDKYRQLWLDEGINSYWTTCYLQDKYGQDARLINMPYWAEKIVPNPTFARLRTYQYLYFSKKGLNQPILSDLPSFYEPSLIFTVAYGKGSAVMDMLGHYLGQDKLLAIMKTYYQRYKFANADINGFIKIAEEVSGKNLEWYADEWLYSDALCDYALKRKGQELILEKRGGIVMPVDVELVYEDGSEEHLVSDGFEKEEVIPLAANKKLRSACADPKRKILDAERINNSVPRKLDIRFVPIYHPLYDIPLFLKDDAYSWITGPSFSKFGIGIKSSFQKYDDYEIYAASHYDNNSECINSVFGFKRENFLGKFMSWGFEFFDRNALTEEENDLRTYKVFVRAEFDLGYSLFENHSHATVYLAHNQSMGRAPFLGSSEQVDGFHYRQNQETIVGTTCFLSNAGAFPDPSAGYQFLATAEVGGHMMGGHDSFVRASAEIDKYLELKHGHKLAFRFRGAGGYPKDKYLFYLGSDTDLRGYNYKDIKGSSALLGSIEYRFPLTPDLDKRFFCNVFSLSKVQGVFFFDAGSAWYNRFNENGVKKDAGFGLRIYFDVAGAAERLALRIDTAYPFDTDKKEGPRVWVGINQAF